MQQASLPVYTIEPPYDSFVDVRRPDSLKEPDLAAGTVVAIRPLPDTASVTVEVLATDILRRIANSPVLLRTDLIPRKTAIALASHAGAAGVYTYASGPGPDVRELREYLTDPAALAVHLPQWVNRRGRGLSPDATCLLQSLVRSADQYTSLGELQHTLGPHAIIWRRVFAHAGLGHPGDWFGALRLLVLNLRLQRNPALRIEGEALKAGYYDGAAFRSRCREVFGFAPTEIRKRLGWEWMIHAACRKYRLLPRRRD